ncbi:GDSL-type esterase/lipase family protein [Streptomyces otsuchiensis]|uniref:GDSL-type esterase/lipase family protein n=1 Tax=Streptomyces otsuchiensis TaxID=2681388 RepID=UPI00103183F4|nr:GDSL-type esterase/lipase family protein [Streptomyces otsuchiensis]
MSASRRTLAILIASVAAVSACSSPVSPSATGEDAGEDSRHGELTGAPDWNTAPTSIAAIGDSISTGFDACDVLADCPEVSWATGTEADVESLASRLGVEESWNEAVAGALMAELPAQAEQAAAYEPELMTVMAGANDACVRDIELMTEVDTFREDFDETLSVIRENAPDTQIFVASIPDLKRLWQAGRENSAARMVWQFGVCPSMLKDAASDAPDAQERRDAVEARVDEFNEVLREVCAEDDNCRFDDGAINDYPFTEDELSDWDWFHPSRAGQRVLAELAYEVVTRD